jgi:hypothetical protein
LLKDAERKKGTEEGLSSQRILETISAQTSFYLPQYFTGRKDYNRAIVSLTVAAEIRPESPWVWHSLAAAYALKGENARAIENLQLSVDRGLKERKYIDEEKAFDALRSNPEFQQILSGLKN